MRREQATGGRGSVVTGIPLELLFAGCLAAVCSRHGLSRPGAIHAAPPPPPPPPPPLRPRRSSGRDWPYRTDRIGPQLRGYLAAPPGQVSVLSYNPAACTHPRRPGDAFPSSSRPVLFRARRHCPPGMHGAVLICVTGCTQSRLLIARGTGGGHCARGGARAAARSRAVNWRGVSRHAALPRGGAAGRLPSQCDGGGAGWGGRYTVVPGTGRRDGQAASVLAPAGRCAPPPRTARPRSQSGYALGQIRVPILLSVNFTDPALAAAPAVSRRPAPAL